MCGHACSCFLSNHLSPPSCTSNSPQAPTNEYLVALNAFQETVESIKDIVTDMKLSLDKLNSMAHIKELGCGNSSSVGPSLKPCHDVENPDISAASIESLIPEDPEMNMDLNL